MSRLGPLLGVAAFVALACDGPTLSPDAGTAFDAGGDAGVDSTHHPDAGPDGGAAAGIDAGPDAGTDAGQMLTLPATLSASVTCSALCDAPSGVIVPAGVTLTFLAGSSATFAPDTQLVVHGTLAVTGSPSNLVTLAPEASTSPWMGVLVESGGVAQVAYAHIQGAMSTQARTAGLNVAATAGTVAFTDSIVEASHPALALAASASIARVVVHNTDATGGASTFDGPITISAGNPTLVDLRVDKPSYLTSDAIVVNGGGPQLSNLTVRNHHCCIHVNASTGMTVSAMDCDTSDYYGFMLSNADTFTATGNNITPQLLGTNTAHWGLAAYSVSGVVNLENNYWGGGASAIEGAAMAMVDVTSYATTPFTDAGMRP